MKRERKRISFKIDVDIDFQFWHLVPSININFHSHELEFEWLCLGIYVGKARDYLRPGVWGRLPPGKSLFNKPEVIEKILRDVDYFQKHILDKE